MEWSDVLVKIAVGACLGFGIIMLAKMAQKNKGSSDSSKHQCIEQKSPPEQERPGSSRP